MATRASEKIGHARRSAQMIVSLLAGPTLKLSEVSEAEGRAQEIANVLAEYRRTRSEADGGEG